MGLGSVALAVGMFVLGKRLVVNLAISDEWQWTAIIVDAHHGAVPLADLLRPEVRNRIK